MKIIVYGTHKVTNAVIAIESFTTESQALEFCEQWGWSYDDESGSYWLSF